MEHKQKRSTKVDTNLFVFEQSFSLLVEFFDFGMEFLLIGHVGFFRGSVTGCSCFFLFLFGSSSSSLFWLRCQCFGILRIILLCSLGFGSVIHGRKVDQEADGGNGNDAGRQ